MPDETVTKTLTYGELLASRADCVVLLADLVQQLGDALLHRHGEQLPGCDLRRLRATLDEATGLFHDLAARPHAAHHTSMHRRAVARVGTELGALAWNKAAGDLHLTRVWNAVMVHELSCDQTPEWVAVKLAHSLRKAGELRADPLQWLVARRDPARLGAGQRLPWNPGLILADGGHHVPYHPELLAWVELCKRQAEHLAR